MKTIVITLFLSLISISIFSQKKELYLNDDLIEITKAEFNKPSNPYKTYILDFELDTLIAHVKVQRIRKGKLPKKTFDLIKSDTQKITGDTIPNNNFIVINYYHGPDKYNTSGDFYFIRNKYKRFKKKMEETKNVSQFFMYKSPKGVKRYGKKLKWIEDKFGTIEKTFFPLHYPCGSYVLIDKHGNYYAYKGEHDVEKIFDQLKDETTFTP